MDSHTAVSTTPSLVGQRSLVGTGLSGGVERSDAAALPLSGSRWAAAAVIALTAGCSYANALLNGFALDDNNVIARNPLVHSLTGVWRAFAHSYWPESTHAGQYRPLAIASFAIDWSLSHGAPMWLHAVNIGWHVAACLLVWQLLSTIVSARGALVGALVFAVHPVHVEAVANLVGRSELMCTTFVIAALLAHRRTSWLAVLLYAAALWSKESGITFLGLAVAYNVLLRPTAGGPRRGDEGHVPFSRRRLALYAGYVGITAIYVIVLFAVSRGTPFVRIATPWVHTSAPARWLTAISVMPQYVRLLAFPFHLHVDYMPQVTTIAHGMTSAVGLGALMIITGVAVGVRTRRTAPAIAFALALCAIAVAPVSNLFFASGIMLAERTLYLPSVAVAIIVGWTWDALVSDTRWSPAGSGRSGRSMANPGRPHDLLPAAKVRPPVIGLVALLILGTFAVRTWSRTPVWHNNQTAMVASLRDEPESYEAHERMANVLQHSGDTTGALREYGVARTLYPGDPYLYQAAAAMVVTRGDSGAIVADRLLDSARLVDPDAYNDVMRHRGCGTRPGTTPARSCWRDGLIKCRPIQSTRSWS